MLEYFTELALTLVPEEGLYTIRDQLWFVCNVCNRFNITPFHIRNMLFDLLHKRRSIKCSTVTYTRDVTAIDIEGDKFPQ